MTSKSLYIPLKDRNVLHVTGKDAAEFLQGLLTIDIVKVTTDSPAYGLMLSPQGKFLYDFFIVLQDDIFWLDCKACDKDEIIKKLGFYKLRSEVEIYDQSNNYEVVALTGPNVDTQISKSPQQTELVRNFCKGIAYLDPRSQKMGGRSFIERDNAYQSFVATGFEEGSHEDYERQRITQGLADGSYDMVKNEAFPLHFGMDRIGAIDFEKGCYVGQEVTARTHYKSNKHKFTAAVEADEDLPEPRSAITIEDKPVGTLTSRVGNVGIVLFKAGVQQDSQLQADGLELRILRE